MECDCKNNHTEQVSGDWDNPYYQWMEENIAELPKSSHGMMRVLQRFYNTVCKEEVEEERMRFIKMLSDEPYKSAIYEVEYEPAKKANVIISARNELRHELKNKLTGDK